MDRQTALKQLSLQPITCQICQESLPSYRILLGKLEYSGIRKPDASVNQRNQNTHQRSNRLDQPSTDYQGEQQNKEQPEKLIKAPAAVIPYLCITCFSKNQQLGPQIHGQSYQQLASRYISEMPLPQYQIAHKCLQLVKQIQQKSNAIVKQVTDKIDAFKFFILKLVKDIEKICQIYMRKVQFMDRLRIQERYKLEQTSQNTTSIEKNVRHKGNKNVMDQAELHRLFYFNQKEDILGLSKKYCELELIKQKVNTINLVFPNFYEPSITPKRKKISICNLPITSMTSFGLKYYLGTSDGNIVFPSLKQFCITTQNSSLTQNSLVFHKAHDSLIRSFSNDDQYTLYSGSDDFTIKAWDVRDGGLKLIRAFGTVPEIRSYHRNICVLQDGKIMVSTRGQFDQFKIRVWQLGDQYKNIKVLKGHQSFIRAMAIASKEKNTIITGSDDKRIKLWSTNSEQPLFAMLRPRKCLNLVVSFKNQLCCIIEQEGKVTIIDLNSFSPILSTTLPRSVQSSCGYSKLYSRQVQNDNDYIVLCMINSIGIWSWDLVKIWSFQMGVTYTPVQCMQFSDRLVLSDGSGSVQEVFVGDIHQIEEEFMKKLNEQ